MLFYWNLSTVSRQPVLGQELVQQVVNYDLLLSVLLSCSVNNCKRPVLVYGRPFLEIKTLKYLTPVNRGIVKPGLQPKKILS